MVSTRSTWLSLAVGAREGHLILEESTRFSLLARPGSAFRDPATQKPSLITIVGGPNKHRLIENLTSTRLLRDRGNGAKTIDPSSVVNLHLISTTKLDSHPVLLADCSLTPQPRSSFETSPRRLPKRWDMTWNCYPFEAANGIIRNIITPFSEILILLKSDLGGYDGVLRYLKDWTRPADVLDNSPPMVIVFEENKDLPPHYDLISTQLLTEALQATVATPPSVRVLSVNLTTTSVLEFIHPILEQQRAQRAKTYTQFSVEHLSEFVSAICKDFASGHGSTSFDLIAITRRREPVSESISGHISGLLQQCKPYYHWSKCIPHIASAMVFDSLPPRMHGEVCSDILAAFAC